MIMGFDVGIFVIVEEFFGMVICWLMLVILSFMGGDKFIFVIL